MGVYNPNMEMPKNCHECDYFTTAWFGHYGELQWLKCRIIHETVKAYYNERHPACPLKEIPEPHGRLIDETEIKTIYWQDSIVNHYWESGGKLAFPYIDAPTVIEAEGEQ